jgi:hypothetical protein
MMVKIVQNSASNIVGIHDEDDTIPGVVGYPLLSLVHHSEKRISELKIE